MKLGIKSLEFSLDMNPFGSQMQKLEDLTVKLRNLGLKAGTGNKKFKNAFMEIHELAKKKQDLASALDSQIKVRALAVVLKSDVKEKVRLSEGVFNKIDALRPKPSSLLLENVYQHYFSFYDRLDNPEVVATWLRGALKKRGTLKGYHPDLLSNNGPKWFACKCIENNIEFSEQLTRVKLDNYPSGRFHTVAKNIYFVEQLKTIPENKPHQILEELQRQSVFESRYDENYLLGHIVLQILIKRAPKSQIDDSWLNTILRIAGDPRVPATHPKYQKWWSQLDPALNSKVKGWLSRLDLRLFLEALENYSYKRGNEGLKRMFPGRKRFLEGLLDKSLITGTRLYLASGFASYLRQNYKKEHLPAFSRVTTGSISVIHIQLGQSHMVEGSHSCQLWVYKSLNPDAVVFNYAKNGATYSELTAGLNRRMLDENRRPLLIDNIVHYPPLNWQNKAISALNKAGIGVAAQDVLSSDDYLKYKRKYGVRRAY